MASTGTNPPTPARPSDASASDAPPHAGRAPDAPSLDARPLDALTLDALTLDALTPDDAEPAGPQLLTFVLGGRPFGCLLEGVREILVGRPAARLPGAAPHLVGLLNLRGTLLTVLDVATRLDPAVAPRATGHVVVVEVDGRLAGCRVDEVRRVRALPRLDPAPAAGNAEDGGIVMGVAEVDGEPVAVLDLPSIVRQTLLFPGER